MLGIFLDTEANGLNSQIHKILEVAFKIVDLESGELKFEYQSVISHSFDAWEKSNPESLRITGFTWEEVKAGQTVRNVSQQIIDLFAHWHIRRKLAVFICQNPSFDRVFFSQLVDPDTQEILNWPYHWLDLASMFWAISIHRAVKNRESLKTEFHFSKDSIAEHFHLPPEAKPHRAMNGVNHLILCYEAVVGFPQKQLLSN